MLIFFADSYFYYFNEALKSTAYRDLLESNSDYEKLINSVERMALVSEKIPDDLKKSQEIDYLAKYEKFINELKKEVK